MPLDNMSTTPAHLAFEASLKPLAHTHYHYLQDSGRKLSDCYILETNDRGERIEIKADIPLDLYDDIRQCFLRYFS